MNKNTPKEYTQEQLKKNTERLVAHSKSIGKGLYSALIGLPTNVLQWLRRAAKLWDISISEKEFLSQLAKKDPSFAKKSLEFIEKWILRWLYIIILASSIGYWWYSLLDHKKEKHKIWEIEAWLELIEGEDQYGLLTWVTSMKIAQNDQIEKERYQNFLSDFHIAQETFKKFQKNEDLKKYLANHNNIKHFLPLVIKETRIDETGVSESGAYGYFQVLWPAEIDINNILTKYGENNLSPATSSVDNIIVGIMYFNHMQNQIENFAKSKNITLSSDDMYCFVSASYNFWINKLKALREASNATNRNKFAKYITKDLMGIKKDPVYEYDPHYWIENYYNRFDRSYMGNKTKIFYDEKRNIILTNEKWEEWIRYAELILAIKKHLNSPTTKPKYIYTPNAWSLFAFCRDLEDKKIIKQWSVASLQKDILLDNWLIDAKYIKKGQQIVLTNTLRKKYNIPEEYNYTYDIVSYNKNKYLRSIVNEMIQDEAFIKSLEYFKEDFKNGNGEVMEQIESVVRQSLIEAIISFNKAHRHNRDENRSEDIYLPPKWSEYYNIYMTKINKDDVINPEKIEETVKEIKEEIKQKWNIYADINLDKFGNQIVSISKGRPNVTKVFNPYLQKKAKENWYSTPKWIIVHGTESKDYDETNPNSINRMNAHYYISKDWKIFDFTEDPKDTKGAKINKKDKIVRLNHAWFGNTTSWYARANSSNKTNLNREATYDFIGIEVEVDPNWKPNEKQYKAMKELIGRLGSHHKIINTNVLTHGQVASSKRYGRGRKVDLLWFDFERIWMPDNNKLIDWAVVTGAVSPNMQSLVKELKKRGLSNNEIKRTLWGLNESIKLNRKVQPDSSKNQNYNKDRNARKTLEELWIK